VNTGISTLNIHSFDSNLLRIFKINDNSNSAALQITSFEAGANQPSLPNKTDVLNQITQSPELAMYREGIVFHGDTNIVIAASSEMADKMNGILNHLNEKSQKHLIDSGLMTDEKFLQLASELDDKELIQLSNVLQGVDTPSTLSFISGTKETQKKLIDVLSTANDETRTSIIEQAVQYSGKITPDEGDGVYNARGNIKYNKTSNDLHSFVAALNKTENVNQFLEKLNGFDEQQQGKLLSVLTLDYKIGQSLIDSLEGKKEEVQSNILNFIGEIATTASKMGSHVIGETKPDHTVLGSDNHFSDISKKMIEDTISILNSDVLSDEQLLEIGSELNDMERINQRAYLAITKIGIEELLEQDSITSPPNKREEIMEFISDLRSNEESRMNIFLTRYGEPLEEGSKFLGYKNKSQADNDMKAEIIKLINRINE
jgi:hypothetical protein